MSLIKSGKLGKITNNREQILREEILYRYQHVGEDINEKGEVISEGYNWLSGLEGHVKDNIALLYENQAKYLNEGSDSNVVGGFEAAAFPMIRRIYSRLLANDIVSVQAMTQPTGAVFFYYPNISERVESVNGDGQTVSSHVPSIGKLPACVGANCDDVTYAGCKSLYDRFYDDSQYDHSKGSFTIITASGATVQLNSDSCWESTSTLKVGQDGSVRNVMFAINGFLGRTSATLNNFTARTYGGRGFEVDTEEFLSSFTVINAGAPIRDPDGKIIIATGGQVPFRLPATAYGRGNVEVTDLCDQDGTLRVEIDITHPITCADCDSYDGYVGAASGTTFAANDLVFAWRRYDNLENETEIGEVTFEIKKVTISVEPRKLRARWTPEMAQDINAYHAIDAEAELTALLSEQIAMEIDRQILRELKRGAAWKLRWNYYGWKNQGSQKYTQKEWNQTLITRINQISAQIHKSTLRGGANFIVVSSEVSAIFDDLDIFVPMSHDLEDYTYNLGMKQIGTVNGRYKVYVDPYSGAGDILIGHKGTSLLDTGYIYAPYLPLQLTQTITDPNTLTLVKGIQTRYATKLVNNKFYGYIRVDQVQTFDTLELR